MKGGVALVLLLLLLTGWQEAEGGRGKGAEAYEQEEWAHLLRQYQIHRRHAQHLREQTLPEGTLPKTREREPDTDWLKTCAGWTAQELCSTIFGSGLDEETAINEDVGLIPLSATDFWIDYEDRSVTASCRFGNPHNMTYKSLHRPHMGCVLVERYSEEEIRGQDVGDQKPPPPLDPLIPWPRGEGYFPEQAPPGIDRQCVARVAERQFARRITNPRAIVVVYKGELVYERYGEKISKENPLLGWSATKSLTSSLVGIATAGGGLDIFKPAPVPEWQEDPGDPRQNITVDMMLRMSSGTRWVGDIFPTTKCLFYSNANCPHVCALQPLVAPPDTLFNYNSGSSYILSRIALLHRSAPPSPPPSPSSNYEWPKKALFHPIGAHSMYIEAQPSSFFLGGAYGYGTPRDWARFGLLYLRDGVWVDGKRILPEGWVKYVSSPSKTNPGYGAHFWRMPQVDESIFYASGFRNQNVFIIPSKDLVVVRMAMPPLAGHPIFNSEEFVREMMECVA